MNQDENGNIFTKAMIGYAILTGVTSLHIVLPPLTDLYMIPAFRVWNTLYTISALICSIYLYRKFRSNKRTRAFLLFTCIFSAALPILNLLVYFIRVRPFLP